MILEMLDMVQQDIQKIVIPQPWVDTEPGDGKRMSASECFLVMTGDCDLFSMATGLLLHCSRSGKDVVAELFTSSQTSESHATSHSLARVGYL